MVRLAAVMLFWALGLSALGPVPALAHGGEDHGEATAPMATGGAGLTTAETRGTYELLLRWGPVVAGEPFSIEAFVADAQTNAPVAGELKLALSGAATLTLEGTALSPGQYRLSGPAATLGRYTVTATVRGAAGVDLLTTELTLASAAPEVAPIAVDDSGKGGVPLLWLVLALVLAAVLAALGYIAGRRANRTKTTSSVERPAELAAAALVVAMALVVVAADRSAGAHGGEDHGAPAAPVAAAGNAVRLPKDVQFLLGVRTLGASRRTLTERRRVAGTVTLPPGARTTLVAPFTGRLEAAPDGGFPRLGEAVSRGQVVAVLVELPIAADRAGLAAERARAAAQRDGAAATLRALRLELQRKRQLTGIVAAQELTDLEAAIGRADADLKGGRAAVDALTLGAGATALQLVAPIDGIIGTMSVTPGGTVEGGTVLFEIVDLARPWVAAKVFEADLRRIDRTASAIVMGDDLPAEGVSATPIAVSPTVDPTTRTVDVIYALDHTTGATDAAAGTPSVRVNQFVRVDLPLGDSHDVLAVPVSAVVELDGVPSLWLKSRAEVFAARPVALGRREGAFVEVRGDIAKDALIVVEGAPFLRGAAPAPAEAH